MYCLSWREEIHISCTYKEFRDIYGFAVKRQYRSLYYSGFRCEKPSEYYAAVFDIQFLSRKPFHHHKREGMQRQGGLLIVQYLLSIQITISAPWLTGQLMAGSRMYSGLHLQKHVLQPSILDIMLSVCTHDKNCLNCLYKNNLFQCEFWYVTPYRTVFSTDDSVHSQGQCSNYSSFWTAYALKMGVRSSCETLVTI